MGLAQTVIDAWHDYGFRQAANLCDALAPHAHLSCAPTGVAQRQHEYPMKGFGHESSASTNCDTSVAGTVSAS